MIFREGVDQFFKELNLFQFGQGVQGCFFEEGQVFLDDIIAESVEGIEVYFIGVGTDKLQQSLAHGHHTGIGVSEAENVFGLCVGIEQDFADPAGQDLGFTGARSGDDHYRAIQGGNGPLLLFVQFGKFFGKFLFCFFFIQ